MNLKFFKPVASALSVLMVFMLFGPSMASAAQNHAYNQQVEEVAQDLEFLMEEATIYDEDGNPIDFDFDKLRDRFGDQEGFELLEESIAMSSIPEGDVSANGKYSKNPYVNCIYGSLLDLLGVGVVQAAMTGGLWAYLKKKAWTEAAKLIMRVAVGTNLATLTASIVYFGVKCNWAK